MIKSIKIKKLFKRFDYELKFTDEAIMIITGPNGYGKSTILNMLNYFCNKDIISVLNYHFKSFSIITTDDKSITIKKNKDTFKINEYSFPYPAETFDKGDIRHIMFRLPVEIANQELYDHIIFRNKEMTKKLNGFDSLFFSILSNREIFSYLPNERKLKKIAEEFKSATDCMDAIINNIGKVHFIKEQRLIGKKKIEKDEEGNSAPKFEYYTVINENSKKLKLGLEEIMKDHSSLSSELDSTYIKRLFSYVPNESSFENMRNQLKELQLKQEKLKKYGLAEIENVSYIAQLDQEKFNKFSTELSIYLEDAKAKYNIFEDIINKLDLYEEIVNSKLTFKKMYLSRTDGIVVKSDANENLSLKDLSSGEQEILVLFYKLIFESNVNLLLIDEPEISLHIAWQKELMTDLKKIINVNKNIQVIIATHSPQIISNNWDLQVDLGGLYNG